MIKITYLLKGSIPLFHKTVKKAQLHITIKLCNCPLCLIIFLQVGYVIKAIKHGI